MKKLFIVVALVLAGCEESSGQVEVNKPRPPVAQTKNTPSVTQPFIVGDPELTRIHVFVDPETKCEYLVSAYSRTMVPRMESRPQFTDRWQICRN